jgi:iron complex transport system substrate-binding protein
VKAFVFVATLAAALTSSPAITPARAVTVVDLAERTVEIPAAPKRILLGVGIDLPTLALIDPDIVSRLAGIGTDLETFDTGTYRAFAARFPALEAVAKTATGMGGVTSVEQALAVRPDLAIFALWQLSRVRPALAAFAKVGVPVIFVDFYNEPIANVGRSLTLLGQALGKPAEAERFRAFYEDRLFRLSKRVAALTGPRPRVYFEPLHNPRFCCWTTGKDSFGAYLSFLRADSIGGETVVGDGGGVIGLEFVLSTDADVMIVTGSSARHHDGQLTFGPGVTPEAAREDLARIAALKRVRVLTAGRRRRLYAMWNFFNGSPLNIAALEAMATWLYPQAFGDLDPQATLRELRDRFMPLQLDGTYWVGVHGAPGSQLGALAPAGPAGR